MNEQELIFLTKNQNISKDKILQEEAEMIFLNKLAKSPIGSKILFYGGTSLRLAYDSPRFSEDIDLLKIKRIEFPEFEEFIDQVINENENWKLKDIKNKKQTMFALFLIKDEKLKHNFSLKIEIHKTDKKIKIENELRLIKSPTSILNPLLLVPTLQELEKLKQNALIERKKARDVYDLWFISQKLRKTFITPKIEFKEREFKNELQVFLPKNHYPIIKQLYGKINPEN
ncbi:nucleotidyl transferase AbiEii/AbiGii toxin family protein [Patescibacteria group bacterium]|nr:nucleotidyl transferase AbiEii/AbiGii toxin family protein [Patescibacteria group bacterium]MBU3922928.1 nucleotidyl transferase AbiEii/AbiGii toxin family protein [Patescibacteria group bacterium]